MGNVRVISSPGATKFWKHDLSHVERPSIAFRTSLNYCAIRVLGMCLSSGSDQGSQLRKLGPLAARLSPAKGNTMHYEDHQRQSKGAWVFGTPRQGHTIGDCTAEGLKALFYLQEHLECVLHVHYPHPAPESYRPLASRRT